MWLGSTFYRNCDIVVLALYPLVSIPVVTLLLRIVEIPTAALIWLTFTTIIIMGWQSLRETHEIVILPNITIYGIRRGAGSAAFESPVRARQSRLTFIHRAIRRPLLKTEEFGLMDHYVVTFDIGNVGFHDVTLHEYFVEKEEPSPKSKVTGLIPLFGDIGQRKILHNGERITGQFGLQIQDDCLTVFRINIICVGLEASRRLYVLKKGDRLQYFDAARKIGLNRQKTERALLSKS